MKHCRNSQILRLRHPRPPPEVRYFVYIFGVQIPNLSLGGGPGCLGNCHHFFTNKIPRKTSKSTGLRAKASLKASVGLGEIHPTRNLQRSIATYWTGSLGIRSHSTFCWWIGDVFLWNETKQTKKHGKKIYEKWYKNQWCYKKGESGRWCLLNGSLAITTRKGAIIKWYKIRIYKHEYKYIFNSHDVRKNGAKESLMEIIDYDYDLKKYILSLWALDFALESPAWVAVEVGEGGWSLTSVWKFLKDLGHKMSQVFKGSGWLEIVMSCKISAKIWKIGQKKLEKCKDFFEILQKPKGSIQNSKHPDPELPPPSEISTKLGPPYTMGATSSMEAISAPGGFSHGK